MVKKENLESLRRTSQSGLANQYKIDLDDVGLDQHDKKAFAKCCETLNFLIRDMAHISLQNFESCIHCLRTFVEACVLGDRTKDLKKEPVNKNQQLTAKGKLTKQKTQSEQSQSQSHKRSISPKNDDSDEEDQFITSYETISLQVIELQ